VTRSFNEVVAAIDGVEGWLSVGQAARLYAAAAACPPRGSIVEIGSFRGRSTIVLASAAPAGATITAIDPHAGNDRGPQEIEGFDAEASADYARFHANLDAAGVDARVRHLRAFSQDVLDQVATADVVYVDGAHRYAPARDDIAGFGARVPAGGTLLIHDAFSSLGVTLAIVRLLVLGRRFRYVGRTASLVEYRADLRPGVRSRTANAARQLAQLPWFARNLTLKAFLAAGGGKLLRRLGRPVPDWPF
jgi:hypothetical protein